MNGKVKAVPAVRSPQLFRVIEEVKVYLLFSGENVPLLVMK
jgi:hypothetical protein